MATVDTFDFIIVGSGSAGSVLASRLTEDGEATVCVLEAGPADRHPMISVPAGFVKMIFNEAYTWPFKTEPGNGVNGRRIPVTQGRTVGGSSSVNGMIFSRGQRADYDQWAQAGNRGWGYRDVLPYFKRLERRLGNADPQLRGREGPVPVTTTDFIHPLCEAFMAGAVAAGLPRNADFNAAEQEGVGYMQRIISGGRRQSAARVYLRPALRRNRIALRTRAFATQILFDGRRACGVEYVRDGNGVMHRVHARREVIVCGGAVNSAKLLQLSGIGPPAVLNELGIAVRHALPVGENLRDHYSVRVVARVRGVHTMNELARGPRFAAQVARWLTGRPSILALSPALVHWFWRSDDVLDDPDVQGIFTPASYKEGFMGLLDDFPGMTAGVNQHRPESVGFVHVRSREVRDDPLIQPNYLSHQTDREVLVKGIHMARRLLRSPELSPFFDREQLPGPAAASDDELLDFARRYGNTSYHLIGTCRMGSETNATAVVDDALRVHGLSCLRVVDASVMPNMPSANTYAATLMIAEKAADLIRNRPAPPPVEGLA